MKNETALLTATKRGIGRTDRVASPCVGRLVHGDGGELLVRCDGPDSVPARLVAGVDRRELLKPENRDREVLVVFEGADPDRPVIIDMLERTAEGPIPVTREIDTGGSPEAYVDGKRIVLEAEQEIVLRCGKGSITIRADGKVVVRGTRLLSRSSGVNRIKGGTVNIN
jgi:hypothetical protein